MAENTETKNGTNGNSAAVLENEPPEVKQAKSMALRYRLPYIDLLPPGEKPQIDHVLLAEIPVDLMLRNHFVPLKREGQKLHVAMADEWWSEGRGARVPSRAFDGPDRTFARAVDSREWATLSSIS